MLLLPLFLMLPLWPLPCCSCSCSCSRPQPAGAIPAVAAAVIVTAAAFVVAAAVVFTAAATAFPSLTCPHARLCSPHSCPCSCLFHLVCACSAVCSLVLGPATWSPLGCAGSHLSVHLFVLVSTTCLFALAICLYPLGFVCMPALCKPLCLHVRAHLRLSCYLFVLTRLCWFLPVCVFVRPHSLSFGLIYLHQIHS